MIAHIPADLALALGADPDDVPPEGLSPCALLVALLGPSTGQERWLTALGEATRLAEAQATPEEIAASLARTLDLAPELATAIVDALAGALDVARLSALAELRARVWGLASGQLAASKEARADALAAAKQYLGWAGGPDSRALADAIREAQREVARAPKGRA